jgi:hypothetical protein
MRLASAFLIVGLAMTGVGCEVRVPAKKPPAAPAPAKVPSLKVSSLGTPSPLINPTVKPGEATDLLPFDLPLGKGYEIEGSWVGPNQIRGTYQFERIGDFKVRKAEQVDVDPKEIRGILERWIESTGVQQTQSSGGDGSPRSIGYGTPQTFGTISITVRPDTPAKEVHFHLEVREQPRQAR